MSDSIMLVCAVFAALAAGVLAAYGVCLGFFATFRVQERPVAVESLPRVSVAASVVEG